MATIKGPSVLEKVLGINGGLGDEWRETGMLNRTAVKPVARATGKVVKGAAILAGAGAVYGITKARVSMMNARTEKMREIMTEFMAVVPARSTVPVILLSSKWLSLKSLKIQPQM